MFVVFRRSLFEREHTILMYLSMSIITNKRVIETFDDVDEKKEKKRR